MDRHNMYNIVKEIIMYIIIIYKYNAHSMTYSLSMLQKNLDLILALTFTCRMPGKWSVRGRTKPVLLTQKYSFCLSGKEKYAEMLFSKLADNLFYICNGNKTCHCHKNYPNIFSISLLLLASLHDNSAVYIYFNILEHLL